MSVQHKSLSVIQRQKILKFCFQKNLNKSRPAIRCNHSASKRIWEPVIRGKNFSSFFFRWSKFPNNQKHSARYTSLPANSYFENPVPSEQSINSFFSTPDNPSTDPVFVYNSDLSNLALQNMNLTKFNELCKISEEGDTLPSNAKYTQPSSKFASKSRTDSYKKEHFVTLNETEAKLPSLDTASIVSEQTSTSMWGDDAAAFSIQDDQQYNRAVETLAIQNTRQLSQKLEVKIRYLLQIFTEANCLDLALLLSILLLDAASISRITNSAIRSGSLAICRQLRNGLKDVTRWSFQEW